MFTFALTVKCVYCGYDGCIRDQPYLQAPACPYRDRDQRSFAVICHKSRLKLVKVTSRAARFAFKTSLFTVLLFLTEIVERAYESAGHKEKNVRLPWPAPMKTSVDGLILYFRSLRSKHFQSSYCVACEYNRFSLFLAASKEKRLYSQTSYCVEVALRPIKFRDDLARTGLCSRCYPGWFAWFSLQIFCLNNKMHFS